MSKKIDRWKTLSKALGSSRVVKLKSSRQGGPLDWITLGQAVKNLLKSSGGRPTNPHWEIKRLVPFKNRTWEILQKEAATMSDAGRKVGPAQLAAILIENCIISSATDWISAPPPQITSYAQGITSGASIMVSDSNAMFTFSNIAEPSPSTVSTVPDSLVK